MERYARGFDSGFATDQDYEDGFVASDATIAGMAERQGISVEAAKRRLGAGPMDRLREMNERSDREDGPGAVDFGYGY